MSGVWGRTISVGGRRVSVVGMWLLEAGFGLSFLLAIVAGAYVHSGCVVCLVAAPTVAALAVQPYVTGRCRREETP